MENNAIYTTNMLRLSALALQAAEAIQRTGETIPETINRILETLAASALDFDRVYGEPCDGRGPSGQ